MKVWTVQKKGGKCDKRLNEIVHNKKKVMEVDHVNVV